MWKSLGKLFGKFSTKWKIITVLIISLLLVIVYFIAKKVAVIALVIFGIIAIGALVSKFKK